jgi:hypothetical protein
LMVIALMTALRRFLMMEDPTAVGFEAKWPVVAINDCP